MVLIKKILDMKRLIMLLTILLPLSAIAQGPTFDSLFKEYSSKDKCTTLNISNAMLQSMNVKIDANYMQVISVENEILIPTFRTQALEALDEFDVIMSVNSDGKTVEIRQGLNKQNIVVDIYLMACSDNECLLMHINGHNLELSNIGSVVNMI